jgi:hypothetical protein
VTWGPGRRVRVGIGVCWGRGGEGVRVGLVVVHVAGLLVVESVLEFLVIEEAVAWVCRGEGGAVRHLGCLARGLEDGDGMDAYGNEAYLFR